MTADQWCPFAAREPGHPQAHGYPGEQELAPKEGLVFHSAEGNLATMRRIIRAPGEPSWTLSNPKRGRLIQHYPRGTHIWANGSREANVRFDACESEGVEGEALTGSQAQNLIDLAAWYKKEEDWAEFKRLITAWEHREMTRFGASPTACPSGRIPWGIIIPGVEEEDMAAIDELRRDVDRLTLENRLQQGAIELQTRINQLQQGWLTQHAEGHGAAPSAELAERVAELEAKVAEAGAALVG